ncbi:glutaminyl-peptide cyclotransferase-like [Copidosoma floridanum]|uniref:glutaminyl-peptide cyclotransferase-like n=1 Tax=Copidosoma floridanum TaxID=29053 RepID=UPI0006C98C75|nr:glutaminyl-peptide cyclotransferase-like [Copidosoma floridanum]
MLWIFQVFLLAGIGFQRLQCATVVPFRKAKQLHSASTLTRDQVKKLVGLTDVRHMNSVLDNICIPRTVGSKNHENVKKYIKNSLTQLGWTVESDRFKDKTPVGVHEFENIIATLNPKAERYLTLACHHDSKIMNFEFVGATDSAVPCMQLINLAKVMDGYLQSMKNNRKLSLMLLFLDGEEAFVTWNDTDSIYGARHLASKWHNRPFFHKNEDNLTELDKIDLFVLLDLIGAPNPKFYNYFTTTSKWYKLLAKIEKDLGRMHLLEKHTTQYFDEFAFQAEIQDDHLPFLIRDVPILHLIPTPFPRFWHKSGDNRNAISLSTVENLNKILRVFVAKYLGNPGQEEKPQSAERLEL